MKATPVNQKSARASSSRRSLVSEVMTRNPIAVDRATSTSELARILLENEISGVPVLDERERVIGVVSRADLLLRLVEGPRGSEPAGFLEALAEGSGFSSDLEPPQDEFGLVEEYMTPEPVTTGPNATVAAVARKMVEERVHRVIVVDEEGRLLGIVTTLDLLRAFPQ